MDPPAEGFNNPFADSDHDNTQTGVPNHISLAPETDVPSPSDGARESGTELAAISSSKDSDDAREPETELAPDSSVKESNGAREQDPDLAANSSAKASRTGSEHDDAESDLHKESTLDNRDTVESAPDSGTGVIEKIRTAAHKFHLESIKATGPSSFFNPTNIRMHVRYGDDSDRSENDAIQKQKELALLWRSRDNRKGRNSIAVPSMHAADEPTFLPLRYTPHIGSNIKGIGRNLRRMFTTFPYWDMSFWSGWSYTIGSALFVADGVIAFGGHVDKNFETEKAETYGGPLCFFIGAMFYQVGAVMAYLEAVNDGSFHGSAMRRLLDGHEEDQKKMLDDKIHGFFSHLAPHHHHHDRSYQEAVDPEAGWRTKEARLMRPGSIYPTGKAPAPRRGAVDMGGEEGDESTYLTWRWYPSWRALRSHHVYEIGWLACTVQLFGVTLYGITAVVVLPGVLSSLVWWQELWAFWIPQVVAASCFLIASLMFMFETQEKWWKPEFTVLGWWIGFWASTGSVGFVLIAIFGFKSNQHTWATYQSDLATIWGSTAYLFSSFLQWYEALDKNPVEELFNEPGKMKSSMVHPI